MTPEYLFGVIYIAAAPVQGCMALLLTWLLHRLLAAWRLYRWVWHPVLFDTALFVLVWTLMVLISPSLTPADILA